MRVPLTTRDFLDRAELVYGDRVGDRRRAEPAGALARRASPTARWPAAAARCRPASTSWASARASGSRSSATTPARLLETAARRPVVGPGAGARSTSGSRPRRSPTSSATPARGCCLSTPSWRARSRAWRPSTGSAPARSTSSCCGFDAEPRAVGGARRGRHRHDQLHQRDDGAAQGRADDPPQHLGQRGHLRHAHAGQRPRRLPAHAADVPLQRLGPAVHDGRSRAPGRSPLRKVDGAEILRRVEQHGVTLMAGAPAVWNAVLDAAADWDGEIPGRDQVRIVVAGAPPPSRTIARVEARAGLGVQPDLRPHRDRAAAHHQPPARRVRRPRRRRSAPRSCRGPASRRWAPGCRPASPARCSRRATPSSPATGRTRTPRPRPSTAAGSTPATAARSTTAAT